MAHDDAAGGPRPGWAAPGTPPPGKPWEAIDTAPAGPSAARAAGPSPPEGGPPGSAEPAAGPGANGRRRPLALGPMNFSDVLDGAFTLYRASARTLVLLSAAFLVPVQLLSAWFNRELFDANAFQFLTGTSASTFSFSDLSAGAFVVTALSVLVVTPLLAGTVCRVAVAAYLGERLGPGAAFRATRGRWWALSLAWVLVHLAEAAAGFACGLPGLVVMGLFVVVAPALVIEDLGPVAALGRSAHLVGSRILPVTGIAVGSGVLVAAMSFSLGWVPGLLGAAAGSWGWVPAAVGSVLTGVLTTPYVAIVASLVYLDARIRREGMDLAILAGELPS